MNLKRLISIALILIALALASACGAVDEFNSERGRGDAPTADKDDSAKSVINMPDQFSNVAHACDGHGHRVFVTTQNESGKAMHVVADETCWAAGQRPVERDSGQPVTP